MEVQVVGSIDEPKSRDKEDHDFAPIWRDLKKAYFTSKDDNPVARVRTNVSHSLPLTFRQQYDLTMTKKKEDNESLWQRANETMTAGITGCRVHISQARLSQMVSESLSMYRPSISRRDSVTLVNMTPEEQVLQLEKLIYGDILWNNSTLMNGRYADLDRLKEEITKQVQGSLLGVEESGKNEDAQLREAKMNELLIKYIGREGHGVRDPQCTFEGENMARNESGVSRQENPATLLQPFFPSTTIIELVVDFLLLVYSL